MICIHVLHHKCLWWAISCRSEFCSYVQSLYFFFPQCFYCMVVDSCKYWTVLHVFLLVCLSSFMFFFKAVKGLTPQAQCRLCSTFYNTPLPHHWPVPFLISVHISYVRCCRNKQTFQDWQTKTCSCCIKTPQHILRWSTLIFFYLQTNLF